MGDIIPPVGESSGEQKPTGYRLLDPPPQCCGTCRHWIYGMSSVNDSECPYMEGIAETAWGYCEKWERANDD